MAGEGFLPSFTVGLYCIFDGLADDAATKETEALALSTRILVCQTPSSPSPTIVTLKIRLDGSEVNSGLTFAYDSPPPVYDISPRYGPVSGGTTVTVIGNLFSSALPTFCLSLIHI